MKMLFTPYEKGFLKLKNHLVITPMTRRRVIDNLRFSQSSDQRSYDTDQVHRTYTNLAGELDKLGIAYIHLSTNTEIPEETYKAIRSVFNNTSAHFILRAN